MLIGQSLSTLILRESMMKATNFDFFYTNIKYHFSKVKLNGEDFLFSG
jgi:hypothetical protein